MVTVSDHFGTFLMITDDNTVLIFLVWESHGAIAGYWGGGVHRIENFSFWFQLSPTWDPIGCKCSPKPPKCGGRMIENHRKRSKGSDTVTIMIYSRYAMLIALLGSTRENLYFLDEVWIWGFWHVEIQWALGALFWQFINSLAGATIVWQQNGCEIILEPEIATSEP